MKLYLPFPHKLLWPNGGRGSHRAVNGEVRKHKAWAYAAAKEKLPACFKYNGAPIKIVLTVFPKPRGPLPDKDNCIAATKAYQDGIALAIGVNDRDFPVPEVVFAPERSGRLEIEVRAA